MAEGPGQLRDSERTKPPGASGVVATSGLKAGEVLILACWLGLATGLLEVAVNVLRRHVPGSDGFYRMSRHFVWVLPLADWVLFLGLGVFLALATHCWPTRGGWASTWLLYALALLPLLAVAFPFLYPSVLVLLAMGAGLQLTRFTSRATRGFLSFVRLSLPALVCVALLLPVLVRGQEFLKVQSESSRPLPAPGSPNILLIILDTVRADHTSLNGYGRPTTPHLQRLGQRGVRFQRARATSPWTLPSHASMFTGRWPHELHADWQTPLDGKYPTLAEFLGTHGYLTAGFVGNMSYCLWDSGLARGFTHYEDYLITYRRLRMVKLLDLAHKVLIGLRALLTDQVSRYRAHLLKRPASEGFNGANQDQKTRKLPGETKDVGKPLDRWPNEPSIPPSHRKDKNAAMINRQFLDWLTRIGVSRRPFFAFLNYMDAHEPYLPSGPENWRFGIPPRSHRDWDLLARWIDLADPTLSEAELALGADAYDNCIRYLDEQLGQLFDELESRGVLGNTLVVITADHGEGLGEHGLFEHGVSLYAQEVHVPLLILLPGRQAANRTVKEVVSLRDLPSTIIAAVGLDAASPFPGSSLARFWNGSASTNQVRHSDPILSEVLSARLDDPNGGRSPARQAPLSSIAEGDLVYICDKLGTHEELYDLNENPQEFHNLAGDENRRFTIDRLRLRLTEELQHGDHPD